MAQEIWTVERLLTWTSGFFAKKGIEAPRRTSEVLLSHVLGIDRVHLYMDLARPLSVQELDRYRALVRRRAAREPTDYLTGRRQFWGLEFQVDERVLVPRPETEQLVEFLLSALPEPSESGEGTVRVLDLCTGSGCVALSAASARKDMHVTATDISGGALDVARNNAARLELAERVDFRTGDLWGAIRPDETFHAIVSNPPYVKSSVIGTLEPEVQKEPLLALDGGEDGLSLIRRIVREAASHLEAGGFLGLEIGEDEGESVRGLLTQAGFEDVEIHRDFAGLDRIATGRRPMEAEARHEC